MEDFMEGMRKAVIQGISKIKNPRAIMLGSNMYIGTDGLIKYVKGNKLVDFFKVRELYHSRDFNSYLAIDVDIKDNEGKREIKLSKNKPVASSLKNLEIESDKKYTKVSKEDGTLIICIEQIELNDKTLPTSGPVRMAIESGYIDSIVRITGNFSVNGVNINISNEELSTNNGSRLSGNLKANSDFMVLHPDGGFSF